MFRIRKHFAAKSTEDGRYLLNLACGSRMRRSWNNIDFSPYAHLAHHPRLARFLRIIRIISQHRYSTLLKVDPEIITWDLRRGIPFVDETFDVVYSSHFIEHLDRDAVPNILKECWRVLKHSGTIRIVVPDLLSIVNRYFKSVELLESRNQSAMKDHEEAIRDLFDQMVRVEAVGSSKESLIVRWIEHLCRGDAKKQGELHRWMYDKYTLTALLSDIGFKKVKVVTATSSRIEGWIDFDLDSDEDGRVYKPGSLYVEGVKS